MPAEWIRPALDSMVDAVVVSDTDGRIHVLNPAALRLFGYTEAEALGQPIQLFSQTGREWELRDIIARISAGDVHHSPEATRQSKSGDVLHLSITWAPIRGATGVIEGMVGVFRDTTASTRVSAALEDRRAADIQASFISALYALGLDLDEAVATHSFDLVLAAQERIGGIVETLRADAERLSKLDLDMSEGITNVLTQLVEQIVPPTTSVTVNLRDANPSADTAQTLVYVATEALLNVVRHSAATRIAVDLRESNGTFVFVIQDDGGGFDTERVSRGLGLARMKQWASRAGGELAVFSVPGMGTTVRATLPSSE